jgi:hypothetical protein
MHLLKLAISPDYTKIKDRDPIDVTLNVMWGCNAREAGDTILTGNGFIEFEGECLLIDKFMDTDTRERYFYIKKEPKGGKNTYRISYFQQDIPLLVKRCGWVEDMDEV